MNTKAIRSAFDYTGLERKFTRRLTAREYTDTCITMKSTTYPQRRYGLSCLSAKLPLPERDLIDRDIAEELADVFAMLANNTRLRLLHMLVREGEACPCDISERLGMKPQAICNQLQRLSDRGIVHSRRDGNKVLYRIVDPCVIDLIDHGLCLLEDARNRQRAQPDISPIDSIQSASETNHHE